MLERFFVDGIPLGLAQAAVSGLLALGVMLLARTREIHLERETVISLSRGIIQVVAVGSVLLLLFGGPSWVGTLVLVIMMIAAAGITTRRAGGVPGAFRVSLFGLGFGSGLVILLMTAAGVIDRELTSLIPVGSMIIANAMSSNSLALDRFRAEVLSHTGHIEAGLALGAAPQVVLRPYVQAAVKASLIPQLDLMRSLGIVTIPGLMAGMILAGSDPVYAGIYQFVILAMIFASSGLTSIATTLFIRSHAFSKADQLLLRPTRDQN